MIFFPNPNIEVPWHQTRYLDNGYEASKLLCDTIVDINR